MVRAITRVVVAGLGLGLLASQHDESHAARNVVARDEQSSVEQQQVERDSADEFRWQPFLPPDVAVRQ